MTRIVGARVKCVPVLAPWNEICIRLNERPVSFRCRRLRVTRILGWKTGGEPERCAVQALPGDAANSSDPRNRFRGHTRIERSQVAGIAKRHVLNGRRLSDGTRRLIAK